MDQEQKEKKKDTKERKANSKKRNEKNIRINQIVKRG